MSLIVWPSPLGLGLFLLATSVSLYVLAHALKTLASIGLHDARWAMERDLQRLATERDASTAVATHPSALGQHG